MPNRAVVSDRSESLVLVDEHDREIGAETKHACHEGEGLLHRAFSIFIFNTHDELLLQRRSDQKPLWPNYWSNTCCSHPRQGESMEEAVRRRLAEELGIRTPLTYLYKFQYHAKYDSVGSEREYCWVYYGRYEGEPDVNLNEIADWRYVDVDDLDTEFANSPDHFTPWLKLEWAELKATYLTQILSAGA